MVAGRFIRFWTPVVILLVVIIMIGSLAAWLRYSPGQPVEISFSRSPEWQGQIYIYGAVTNPGLYPLLDGDSLEELIRAAGGTTGSANLSGLKLYVPEEGEWQAQKVDINRAEVWLLKSLPGIGETLAQRIVDYRRDNGPYRSTSELQKVSGIGESIYQQIKDLITVAD